MYIMYICIVIYIRVADAEAARALDGAVPLRRAAYVYIYIYIYIYRERER